MNMTRRIIHFTRNLYVVSAMLFKMTFHNLHKEVKYCNDPHTHSQTQTQAYNFTQTYSEVYELLHTLININAVV